MERNAHSPKLKLEMVDDWQLTTLDVDKVCRVCLQEKLLAVRIFAADYSIITMIESCTDVKITESMNMPSALCEDCFSRLQLAYQFKQQCEQSDRQLRSYCQLQSNLSQVNAHIKEESPLFNVSIHNNEEMKDSDYSMTNAEFEITPIDFTENIFVDVPDTHNKCATYELSLSRRNMVKKPPGKCKKKKRRQEKSLIKMPKRGYQCFDCKKSFSSAVPLRQHMPIHNPESFKCPKCQVTFIRTASLDKHVQICGKKTFQCEFCSKLYAKATLLRRHQIIHSDIKRFECEYCGKGFKTKKELVDHTAIHTDTRHPCKYCDKGFHKLNNMKLHVRTMHEGVKPHNCTVCGKAFSNTSNLKCHLRTHTGEKPFICKQCGARFSQSSTLSRHSIQHKRNTTEPPIPAGSALAPI